MESESCPGPSSSHCNGSDVSLDIGRAPSYVAIVSSTTSCLGSLLILLVYALFEDVRSTAQKIVTLLALADLVTALGYIIGSVNFLAHFNATSGCGVFEVTCEVQSAITSWSSLCSFAWTFVLALHFYLLIVWGRARLSTRLLPLYHALAWGLPLLVILPIAASRKLGYAPYAASNWCYVRDAGSSSPAGTTLLIFLVAGKLWEMAAYVVVPILYVIITVHLARVGVCLGCTNGVWLIRIISIRLYISQAKRNIHHSGSGGEGGSRHVEKRLLAIPLLFLVLRLWGTVQLFFALAVSRLITRGCVPPTILSIFVFLGVLQASVLL